MTEDIDEMIEEAKDWHPPLDPKKDYEDRSTYYFRHLLDAFEKERAKVVALQTDNTKMRNMLAGDAALIENLGLPMNSIHSEVSLKLAQQLIACRAEIAALKKECEQYRDSLFESQDREP
jgi:hypothetical protein